MICKLGQGLFSQVRSNLNGKSPSAQTIRHDVPRQRQNETKIYKIVILIEKENSK